jgi:arylsulfatase A
MGSRDGLNPKAITLAERFKTAGYTTGISGKWHIGHHPETRPHRQGFDSTYFIPLSNNQTDEIWRDDTIVLKPFENLRFTEQFTNEAKRFIRENGAAPFFLYLPYSAPHFPVEPHADWAGRSAFGKYGDVVEEMDARIGEILSLLDELKLTRHTLVVFTSDNGPQPREKADSFPHRGEKWSTLEGGTRVPCIFSWPDTIPAGRTSDALFAAIDLMPTLLRACGIELAPTPPDMPPIDGIDLWDTIVSRPQENPRTELLLWHGMEGGPQAFRQGPWKLFFDRRHAFTGPGTGRIRPEQAALVKPIRSALIADIPNPPILFNVLEDPGETRDRTNEHPEIVQAMQDRANTLIAELNTSPTLPLHTPGE